ncbi:MAG: diguanylate cyclase [Lachnospiraceae bacterium]|nr:diguanylate cyclase [Lachnospiraceae bacterium]
MKHRIKTMKKNTLARRLFLPMVLIVCLYALIFMGMVWYGGVFSQLKDNEIERIQQSLNRKVTDLEEQFESCWANEKIYEKLLAECKTTKEVSLQMAERLNELAEIEEVRGAYIFYNNGSCYYVRKNEAGEKEAAYGLEVLLEQAGVPKSPQWKAGSGGDMSVCPGYGKIVQAIERNQESDEFFYACADTTYLQEQPSQAAVTFSVPALSENGSIWAVVGMELSEECLYDILADPDVQGTYLLGVQDAEKSYIEQAVMEGDSFQEKLKEQNGIWLVKDSAKDDRLYRMASEGTNHIPYVLTKKVAFYKDNSAFSQEAWLLCAIVEENELLGSVNRMKKAIISAILIASFIGVFALFFLSRILTKPITALVNNLNELDPRKNIQLPKVHIYEVDRLSYAIERFSKEVESYALRNSQILKIADIPVGVAEIDEVSKEVFCTAKMFELLGDVEPEEDHKVISIGEFRKLVERFKRGTVVFEEGAVDSDLIFCDNNIYKVYSGEKDAGWTSFQTRETNGRLIVVVMDVTDKIREKLKLEYERDYDELTHLLNKQAFAREATKRIESEKYPVGAMIMWDLDNLKTINDTYGHEYGDVYIKEAGKVFAYLEQHNGLVARRSGDEFFAYVSGKNKDELWEVIQQIHHMLEKVVIHLPGNVDMNVRASAGIVWYPKDGREYADLIKKADFTMYDVKRSDKGNIREFDQELYERDAILLTGKEELNEILIKRKFKIAYQPVVDALTGDIYGYEALMRPQTDTLQRPKDVIRIARAQDRLEELEEVYWEESLNDFFREKQMKTRLFINSFAGISMSEESFYKLKASYRREDLQNVVADMMGWGRIDRECLAKKKEQAALAGSKLSVEGYNLRMGFTPEEVSQTAQFVKIGKEFISGIDKNEQKQQEVIQMIHGLKEYDILIVAVGVETEAELRFMQKQGADFVQGFYLASPSLRPLEEDRAIKDKIRM